MLKKLFFCSSLVLATFLLLATAPAPLQAHTPKQPQTTIEITYVGAWPDEAKTALQYSADMWEGLILTSQTLHFEATWYTPSPQNQDFLAFAKPDISASNVSNAPYPDALYLTCLALIFDPDAPQYNCDFRMTVNSTKNWYLGIDGQPEQNQYDLVTATSRAFGQALGLETSGTPNYNDSNGQWGSTEGYYTIYDRFLINGSGERITDFSLFPNNSIALLNQFTSNNLFFAGPLTVAANQGQPVKIYAPTSWAYTNSVEIHRSLRLFDEATYPAGTPNSLMTPVINPGEAIHHPGPLALAVLYDLGWPQPPVPPEIPFLPSHMMLPNTTYSFDLWAYVDDSNHEDNTLQFTLVSSSEANAGVTLRDNRFIDIEPAADWTGHTVVEIQATNPDNLSTTQTFKVFVVTEIHQQFLPLLQR